MYCQANGVDNETKLVSERELAFMNYIPQFNFTVNFEIGLK